MMQIDLPETITGSSFSERSVSFLHNYYNIDGRLLPRERMRMIAPFNDAGNTGLTNEGEELNFRNRRPRALMKNATGTKLYSIIGDKVYLMGQFNQLEPSSVFTLDEDDFDFGQLIGTIGAAINTRRSFDTPNEKISWVAGFNGIAFTTGDRQYFIGDDDVVVQLFSEYDELTFEPIPPPFDGATSVEYIDGRYLWLDQFDRLVFFSEVNDAGNVSANSFFDSETIVDSTNEMIVIGNELYVFGDRSIERFRASGNFEAPYNRVTNSVLSVGLVGGLIKRQDSAIFIGRESGGPAGVYILSNGRVTKISSVFVDEILNTGYSFGVEAKSILSCEAISFSSYGRNVYVFNLVSYANDDLNGNRYFDAPLRTMSLYCIDSQQGYKWGFLSNRAEQRGGDEISNWDELGYHYFEYTSPVFYKNRWFFLRSPLPKTLGSPPIVTPGTNQVGLYVMGNDRFDGSELKPEGNSGETDIALKYQDVSSIDEPISRGIKTFFRDPLDKELILNSVEVVFSKQWGLDVDGSETDSGDALNLTVEGDNGPGQKITREFGSLGNRGRLVFYKNGGLASAGGHIGAMLETTSDNMFVIEKVIVNG